VTHGDQCQCLIRANEGHSKYGECHRTCYWWDAHWILIPCFFYTIWTHHHRTPLLDNQNSGSYRALAPLQCDAPIPDDLDL
jgi:hypothetical protein